jgi:hypothetical protein
MLCNNSEEHRSHLLHGEAWNHAINTSLSQLKFSCRPTTYMPSSKTDIYKDRLESSFQDPVWVPRLGFCPLTPILLMWRIRWAPNNASKWEVGFNSAFNL